VNEDRRGTRATRSMDTAGGDRSQSDNRRRGRRFPRFLVCTGLAVVAFSGCGTRPDERRRSIYELRSAPTAENVGKIRGLIADPDRDVRATALNALVGLGVPDSAALARAALDDDDGFVRAVAAKLLGDLGGEDHAEALAGVLATDPDPIARQRAAESLARMRGPLAVEALAAALRDPMDRVRRAAIQALGQLAPGYARDDLLRLLREDPQWEIRAEAAQSLGRSGDTALEPDLRAALDDPNEFVRSAALNALRLLARSGPGTPAAGRD